ncbi:MAG TPA: FAD-dependent oxidoreductase [Gaiellaceae bacterium]|nr:FAD-dependent oxidoreductase [Gaiellaceae bacterium]
MTRVAVVGAGVMGCAAAWALAEGGAEVTVLEQFDLDHTHGSSHGRTRIVRVAYPDEAWVRLAREAMDGWRELEAESGQALLGLHGLVEVVSSPELTSAGALDACGEPYRFLDAVEARALGVELPDGWTALEQPEAGVVRADLARRAFLDAAVARGARLETGVRVESADDVDADVVVLAAGPWIRRLVPDVPVRVTRETIAYFRRDGAPAPSVVELDETTRGHAMYALHDPVHGLKAGAHHAGAETDPDEEGEPDGALVERVAAWVAARLPDADPDPVGAETCIYTSTADESFVLERRGRVVVGSACSGHGFKFAPAVGRRLAALALRD